MIADLLKGNGLAIRYIRFSCMSRWQSGRRLSCLICFSRWHRRQCDRADFPFRNRLWLGGGAARRAPGIVDWSGIKREKPAWKIGLWQCAKCGGADPLRDHSARLARIARQAASRARR